MWLDRGWISIGAREESIVRLVARAVCLQAAVVQDRLGEILLAAADTGLSVCLLKGAALEPWIYPGPGFRPMGDIDLLVAPDEQSRFEAILRRHDYVQRSHLPASFYADHHHSMPFWNKQHGFWIEVHTRLFPAVADAFRKQQEAFNYGGIITHRLNAHAQALYTAAHWAYTFPGDKGLIGLIDLGLLLQNAGMPDLRRYQLRERDRDWLLRALSTACALLPSTTTAVDARPRAGPEAVRRRLLLVLGNKYVIDDKPYTRWNSSTVVADYWCALMNTNKPTAALGRLPWWFLFPPRSTNRFSPALAWQRMSRLWRQQF